MRRSEKRLLWPTRNRELIVILKPFRVLPQMICIYGVYLLGFREWIVSLPRSLFLSRYLFFSLSILLSPTCKVQLVFIYRFQHTPRAFFVGYWGQNRSEQHDTFVVKAYLLHPHVAHQPLKPYLATHPIFLPFPDLSLVTSSSRIGLISESTTHITWS